MENVKISPQDHFKVHKNKSRVYGRDSLSRTNNAIKHIEQKNATSFGTQLFERELIIPYSDNLRTIEKNYFKIMFWWIVKLVAIIISIPVNIIYYGVVKPYRFLKYCYQVLCYAILCGLFMIYKVLRFIILALLITFLSMIGYHIFFIN